MTRDELKALIRTVPDFPAKGIQFRDITTLIGHGPGLKAAIRHLAAIASPTQVDAVAGMEARGFIFGTGVATALELGFIPLRKQGKLPVETIGVDYQLEYGVDRLEMDPSAIVPGQKVTIVDDLLATGGTALAAAELLRKAGAKVEQALFVIDLPDLGGADRLRAAGIAVHALMDFEGE